MHAALLRFDGTPEAAQRALGSVACAALRAPGGKRIFDKGHVITEKDLLALESLAGVELPVLVPGEGDLHEDEAAMRLGRAAAGPGIIVAGPSAARARLVAAHDGLFRADDGALRAMNATEGVSIFTLFDMQPVRAGTLVAEAKVTPLLIGEGVIEEAENAAAGSSGRPLRVIPFRPLRAGALVLERMQPRQAQRMVENLARKVEWFGSTLIGARYISPDSTPDAIADEMREMIRAGAGVLFVSGGSAADPFDPLLSALPHVPARLDRVGIPVHPGSMLWLAHTEPEQPGSEGRVPILGVPSCGVFSQSTSFDLVLPRLLVGEDLSAALFAGMGHGGLLHGPDRRFAPYEE